MSQSVHDVLSAITVASEALTREPQLQSQITTLESQLNSAQSHGQELELKIIGYKNCIDSLNDNVRSLEVERDDAQFRTLQLEEAYNGLVSGISNLSLVANENHNRLNPPKPEPTVEQAVPTVVPETTGNPAPYTGGYGSSQTTSTSPSETGQSVSPPSIHTDTPTTTQSNDTVGSTKTPSPEDGTVKGIYEGRNYMDMRHEQGTSWSWPSYNQWKEGDGSDEGWNK